MGFNLLTHKTLETEGEAPIDRYANAIDATYYETTKWRDVLDKFVGRKWITCPRDDQLGRESQSVSVYTYTCLINVGLFVFFSTARVKASFGYTRSTQKINNG